MTESTTTDRRKLAEESILQDFQNATTTTGQNNASYVLGDNLKTTHTVQQTTLLQLKKKNHHHNDYKNLEYMYFGMATGIYTLIGLRTFNSGSTRKGLTALVETAGTRTNSTSTAARGVSPPPIVASSSNSSSNWLLHLCMSTGVGSAVSWFMKHDDNNNNRYTKQLNELPLTSGSVSRMDSQCAALAAEFRNQWELAYADTNTPEEARTSTETAKSAMVMIPPQLRREILSNPENPTLKHFLTLSKNCHKRQERIQRYHKRKGLPPVDIMPGNSGMEWIRVAKNYDNTAATDVAPAYWITVPKGVKKGQPFPVIIKRRTTMLLPPDNKAKPGMKLRILSSTPPTTMQQQSSSSSSSLTADDNNNDLLYRKKQQQELSMIRDFENVANQCHKRRQEEFDRLGNFAQKKYVTNMILQAEASTNSIVLGLAAGMVTFLGIRHVKGRFMMTSIFQKLYYSTSSTGGMMTMTTTTPPSPLSRGGTTTTTNLLFDTLAAMFSTVLTIDVAHYLYKEKQSQLSVDFPLQPSRMMNSDTFCDPMIEEYERQWRNKMTNQGSTTDDQQQEQEILDNPQSGLLLYYTSVAKNCKKRRIMEERLRQEKGLDSNQSVILPRNVDWRSVNVAEEEEEDDGSWTEEEDLSRLVSDQEEY